MLRVERRGGGRVLVPACLPACPWGSAALWCLPVPRCPGCSPPAPPACAAQPPPGFSKVTLQELAPPGEGRAGSGLDLGAEIQF